MNELQKNHDRQNTDYVSAKAELFQRKPKETAELDALANDRLDKLCEVISQISDAQAEAAPYVETLDLFVSFFDDVILECAELTDRREEIEEKIIALCKKALTKPTAASKRDPQNEHVTAKVIDCMNTQPTAEISQLMAMSVLDNTNPLRLGFFAYKNFCEQNPDLAAEKALDYMNTEAAVRTGLIKGNDQLAYDALEKLLKLPFDCPEKYLLASLNSFYHGFDKDARRALEIGLQAFPGNERLLSAKGALG
jgi:hypothetical protein